MKGKMTVSHAKFQYYRHNYCLVCMTGLLGCRWHRYQQSTRDNRKRDIFLFSLFTLTFLYMTFYFYFWLIGENEYSNLEWFMFQKIKVWVPWYKIMLPLTCAVFGYFLLVMLLYLCHIGHGHQIYIHLSHVVFIALTLAACVVFTVLVDEMWQEQYHVVYLSLQMFGPFLHIGAVVIMTTLMWFISHSWYKLSNRCWQLVWLIVMVGGMVGLYIAPLYIFCPCVSNSSLPPKPRLFAHRGAEGVAPENTEVAFQKAIQYGAFGLESDVRLSKEGIPIVNHDSTFLRTTNVKDLFPDRAQDDVSLFNMTEIRSLNAGNWFMDLDPFSTAGSVSDDDRRVFSNQSVLTLTDLLRISTDAHTMLMFDVREPVEDSPFHHNFTEQVIQTLVDFNFNLSKLYWLIEVGTDFPSPPGAVLVYAEAPSVPHLLDLNMSTVNVRYDEIDADRARMYRQENITTNLFVIDSAWFFSYYWCLGVSSVTTRRIDLLHGMDDPAWTMTESSYMIMWIATDVISAIIIFVIFIVQRIRLFGTSFSPESVSLTSARRARTYRSRTMKEKLLRDGIIDPMEEGGEGQGSAGVVNHPAAYSMSSLPVSNSFSGAASIQVTSAAQPDHKYEVE